MINSRNSDYKHDYLYSKIDYTCTNEKMYDELIHFYNDNSQCH